MGSMDNLPITYLSFWDVELDNLPAGLFSKRGLSTAEAGGILNAARSSDTLVWTYPDLTDTAGLDFQLAG